MNTLTYLQVNLIFFQNYIHRCTAVKFWRTFIEQVQKARPFDKLTNKLFYFFMCIILTRFFVNLFYSSAPLISSTWFPKMRWEFFEVLVFQKNLPKVCLIQNMLCFCYRKRASMFTWWLSIFMLWLLMKWVKAKMQN